MAAAGNTLLDLGIGFLDSLLQDIFKGLLTDKVKNIIDRRNVERAIQRCAEAPGESLERFFRDERVDEPNAQIVLDEVKAAINAAKVDAAMLAAASINADKLTNAILDIRPAPPSITEAGLEWPYKMAIQIASDALCAIGPCMPEWERENWRRNFDVLDKISANQEKILASVGPGGEGSADERFERSYRSRMLTKLSSIDASTLRIASGICLDLPTLFVQPDVRPLPARSDVEACEEEGECLASLEETRKLFFSQADEGGSSRLSAERFVNDCTRCAIVGLPGTGKSTLLQHLLLAACSEQNSFLPVLVKARELAVGGFPSADDLLALAVSPVFFDARPGFIRRQFEAGRVMLLIDGLDEMTVDKRDELVAWLSDLIELYGNCKYIISSRPAGYQSNVFRNLKFTEVTLLEFSEDQIQEYVKRWSRAVAVAEGATQEEADSAGEQTAKSLLSSAQKNPYVRRLAHNPLLLSTLCLVQKYEGGELPHRRVVLYQRCVEGLLFHWDKKRGLPESILGSLTLDRKLMLLRRLAIEMQVLGVAEIREEDIRASFTTTLAQVGDSTDIELILENIRDRSGLLVERRPAVYGFSHLTFQEYLTALSINEGDHPERDRMFLLQMKEDAQWHEVTALYAGMAPHNLTEGLLLQLLDTQQPDCIILAVECLLTAVDVSMDVRRKVIGALMRIDITASNFAVLFELLPELDQTMLIDEALATMELGINSCKVAILYAMIYPQLKYVDAIEHNVVRALWRGGIDTEIIVSYGISAVLRLSSSKAALCLGRIAEEMSSFVVVNNKSPLFMDCISAAMMCSDLESSALCYVFNEQDRYEQLAICKLLSVMNYVSPMEVYCEYRDMDSIIQCFTLYREKLAEIAERDDIELSGYAKQAAEYVGKLIAHAEKQTHQPTDLIA